MSERRNRIATGSGQLFALPLVGFLLLTPGCFTSELPPGFQISTPDNGATDQTSTGFQLSDTVSDASADTPATPDVTAVGDSPETTPDSSDTPAFRFLETRVSAEIRSRSLDGQTEEDIPPPPPDAPVEEISTPDSVNADAAEEIAEDISLEDCPTCEGTPAPTWSLNDFQPGSEKFGQFYGLEAFKGRIVVLALLAGW